MKTIVNLTPHALNIHSHGTVLTVPPSGMVARVSQASELHSGFTKILGIEVSKVKYGNLVGLPDVIDPDTAYVVSGMVLDCLARQYDGQEYNLFFKPGDAVRDENGAIVGCRGLAY